MLVRLIGTRLLWPCQRARKCCERATGSERTTNFRSCHYDKQKLAFDDERCAPITWSFLFMTKILHDGGVFTLAMTIYQKKKFHVIFGFTDMLMLV
jgi:hypothetical protein